MMSSFNSGTSIQVNKECCGVLKREFHFKALGKPLHSDANLCHVVCQNERLIDMGGGEGGWNWRGSNHTLYFATNYQCANINLRQCLGTCICAEIRVCAKYLVLL